MAVTTTEINYGDTPSKIKFAWTSDGDGDASGTTASYYHGRVLALVTVPGTPASDANYDVAITDSDSVDVLAGSGADRSETATEHVTSGLGVVVHSKLTITVSDAGDTKTGACYLWIE